jgi:cytochrome b561/polyisoprenoid-binding protein YceI
VERNDYTAVAKSLHWLIALVIFVQFPLAWVMDDFKGIQKFQAYNFHKSLGITVLALMVLRLVWRVLNKAPTLPASMPVYERGAAKLAHFALYLAIFLMALSGWAMISASDKPSVLFQYTRFPLLPWISGLPVEDKRAFAEFFENAHGVLANVLLVLIGGHIAAVLRHAIILKDGAFSRMLPRFGGASSSLRVSLLLLCAAALSFAASTRARASEWSVDPQKSSITFEANGSGYIAKGSFSQFKAEIEFDPDLPAETSVKVLLNMASAATGTSDVDAALNDAEYFNPKQFPTAQFAARGAEPAGDGKYVLNGHLTLKGITKPISLPFSIDITSGSATVTAEAKINRLDFGVGPESVAGLAIDKDVKLTINLTAVRLDN